MRRTFLKPLCGLGVCALLIGLPHAARSATMTVNTAQNSDARDGALSLTEAILVSNGSLAVASLDGGESAQVVGTPGTNDLIGFNIPGPGPHTIQVPGAGGYLGGAGFPGIESDNTLLDGYTQPGSSPNTNSILQPNNAVLGVILSAQGLVTPVEFDILTMVGANITVRGFSILGDQFTAGADNYGVNFRDPSAVGGQFAGCWLGVHPDGVTVSGMEIGIGACSTGGGQIIGTNGDGVSDRAEFNVIAGHNVNTIIEGAVDCRISGNFIGVLPDGLTAADNGTLGIGEGDANEGGDLDNLIFGTNSDGVADEDERNIVGGMADDVFQHYFATNPGIRVMGNYFGVGIDGTTAIPNDTFIADQGDPYDSMQVGSDLDGLRDQLEANVIANHTGDFIAYDDGGPFTEPALVSFRGNSLFGNSMNFGSIENSAFARYLMTGDENALKPTLLGTTTADQIAGTVPVTSTHPSVEEAAVDLYVADSNSGLSPQGRIYIGTFLEGSVSDLDPADGGFLFDISGLVAAAGVAGQVDLTVTANAVEAAGTATSQFSNRVNIVLDPPSSVENWSLFY